MNVEAKRAIRLGILLKFYLKNDQNDTHLINRAMQMGVTEVTAKSYLKTIKIRVTQLRR